MKCENIMRSKKPDIQVHMLYDSIHMKIQNGNSIETESRLVVTRGWEGGMGV